MKQNQTAIELAEAVSAILQNRCSLSGEDFIILTEAVVMLKSMGKGKTYQQKLEIATKVIVLLSKYFHD